MQCYYCEIQFSNPLTTESNRVVKTKDHIIPVSKGGANIAKNRVFACYDCNVLKGNMMPEEFCTFLRECKGFKGRDIAIMLKNAEALVFQIAPYRDELVKPGGAAPLPGCSAVAKKNKGRKGFDPEWSTYDKDSVILSGELKTNTERVIKMADAAKAKSAYKDCENWH